ncbi:MAG: YtxH domain-containing protein [Chlamydiales bacterium]
MYRDDHPGRDFLLGAMIGSTLGALTAMMFTTKTGHKIQHDMAGKYQKIENMMRGYVHGGKRRVKQKLGKIAKRAKKKLHKVRKILQKS